MSVLQGQFQRECAAVSYTSGPATGFIVCLSAILLVNSVFFFFYYGAIWDNEDGNMGRDHAASNHLLQRVWLSFMELCLVKFETK